MRWPRELFAREYLSVGPGSWVKEEGSKRCGEGVGDGYWKNGIISGLDVSVNSKNFWTGTLGKQAIIWVLELKISEVAEKRQKICLR